VALFQSKIITKLYIRCLIKIKYETEKGTKFQKFRNLEKSVPKISLKIFKDTSNHFWKKILEIFSENS